MSISQEYLFWNDVIFSLLVCNIEAMSTELVFGNGCESVSFPPDSFTHCLKYCKRERVWLLSNQVLHQVDNRGP